MRKLERDDPHRVCWREGREPLGGARFATTTEGYPDSPRTTPAVCIEAQVAAVSGALAFAVS